MPTEYESNDTQNNQPFLPQGSVMREDNDDALWQLLSVYLDGETTPEETAQVEAMLRDDPAYARDFAFLKMASVSVQSLPEVEPPAFLRDSIFAATSHRPTFARRVAAALLGCRQALVPAIVRYALPTGAVAAAAILAVVFWQRNATAPGPHVPAGTSVPLVKASPPPRPVPANPEPAPEIPNDLPRRSEGPNILRRMAAAAQALDVKVKAPAAAPEPTERRGNRLIANAVVTPKRDPAKSAKVVPPLHPAVQPQPQDSGTQVVFAKLPMMDDINQRPVLTMANAGLDTPEVRTADTESPTSTQPAAASNSAISTDAVTPPRRRWIRHLAIPQPPNSNLLLTSADMRRERNAEMLGYSPDVVENIHRREAGVSIGGRF
jgi:hypothetical protein